jgi:hypothetical protein
MGVPSTLNRFDTVDSFTHRHQWEHAITYRRSLRLSTQSISGLRFLMNLPSKLLHAASSHSHSAQTTRCRTLDYATNTHNLGCSCGDRRNYGSLLAIDRCNTMGLQNLRVTSPSKSIPCCSLESCFSRESGRHGPGGFLSLI